VDINILQVYPDKTTKSIVGEPLTIYVTAQFEKEYTLEEIQNKILIEIWTNIKCKESQNINEDYAAKLEPFEQKGDIIVFRRTLNPEEVGFYNIAVRFRETQEQLWRWYGGNPEQKINIPINIEPAWITEAILYNAFVRQFGAKDDDQDGIVRPGEGGTFNDLIERIDHFKKLGIGAIYLNPIQNVGEIFRYEQEGIDYYEKHLTNQLPVHMHPGSVYSIKEYKSIDPELGLNSKNLDTDQYHEFKRFCDVCHKNGIRVILDVVFDHTARDCFLQRIHPEWFVYRKNPKSLEGEFITPEHPEAEKYWGKPDYAFSPYDHDVVWGDCTMVNWDFYYGIQTWGQGTPLPPLNPEIKKMREYFKSVLKYWIKNYGVDGFRLDVAYAVPDDFWHEALEECREYAKKICKKHKEDATKQECAPISPDIIFVGETYVDRVYELQECGITMLNGDFTWKLFNPETLKGYLDYAYNISSDYFPHGSHWLLFPECHDGPRLPKKFAEIMHTENADVNLNKSRWALTALLPGTPQMHNGYEVVEHEQVSVQTYTPINWESQKNITEYIATINKVRNENIALQRGTYKFIDTQQGVGPFTQLFAFVRDYRHDNFKQTCIVIVNMDINNTANHVQIHLPHIDGLDFSKPFRLRELITGKVYERDSNTITIVLEPGECHVVQIEQD